ncbi:MAG: hypothetical protein ACRDGL_10425, partial [Candidatus Limnocylindrales bacterium]
MDRAASDWVRAQHGGARVTPTVRLGEGPGALVTAEPTTERLETLLVESGRPVRPIRARELHGAAADRPLPLLTLATPDDPAWRPEALGARIVPLLCFLHGPACLVCEGWAHQLDARAPELGDLDARAVYILPAGPEAAATWRDALATGAVVVSDPEGAWRAAVAGRVGADASGVLLVVADRYRAPRAWLAD